jgi:transcriptional regulator with XRE-family HTH domain
LPSRTSGQPASPAAADGVTTSPGAVRQSIAASVGAQIRSLRRSADVPAVELARRAGLSNGMLSKIERGSTSPSIQTLAALAGALGVPIARFFAGYGERRDCSIVKAGKGVRVERRGTRVGHEYQLLGHTLSGDLFVEPYRVVLTGEAVPYPSFQHTGVEFLFLLEGEMRYRYADRVFALAPGDALLFDATAMHGPEVLDKRPVEYLSIVINLRA